MSKTNMSIPSEDMWGKVNSILVDLVNDLPGVCCGTEDCDGWHPRYDEDIALATANKKLKSLLQEVKHQMTSPQQDNELHKIVEDSVRHARTNVGYAINNHDAKERNISMNVETIMVGARLYAHKMVVAQLKHALTLAGGQNMGIKELIAAIEGGKTE